MRVIFLGKLFITVTRKLSQGVILIGANYRLIENNGRDGNETN